MNLTAVVFVHGFNSNAGIWEAFKDRLEGDRDFPAERFRFLTFAYPTSIMELNPTKRIPSIADCGDELANFIKLRCANAEGLFLVGHSMGGLVIEAMLAAKLKGYATELKRIRGVIQFATPNRGSNLLSDTRSIITWLTGKQPQEQGLRTLNEDTDEVLRDVERGILRATEVTKYTCPIAFQVFYGLKDGIVSKVSARGPFDEVGALPGDHSSILNGAENAADDPNDLRYLSLKDALLNPLGHPSIYEISLFEVTLAVKPVSRDVTFQIPNLDVPVAVKTDNVAVRTIAFHFSDKNRCHTPYKQVYRSTKGFVEFLSTSSENEATSVDKSTYRSEGKLYTYVFTPDHGDTFTMKLRIYNGFGEGDRNWHNHMDPKARYQRFRITLDLHEYEAAGYRLTREPRFCYFPGDAEDHQLCDKREEVEPWPALEGGTAWKQTWELERVQGGVVDLVWDVSK